MAEDADEEWNDVDKVLKQAITCGTVSIICLFTVAMIAATSPHTNLWLLAAFLPAVLGAGWGFLAAVFWTFRYAWLLRND